MGRGYPMMPMFPAALTRMMRSARDQWQRRWEFHISSSPTRLSCCHLRSIHHRACRRYRGTRHVRFAFDLHSIVRTVNRGILAVSSRGNPALPQRPRGVLQNPVVSSDRAARHAVELGGSPTFHLALTTGLALAGQKAESRAIVREREAISKRKYVAHTRSGTYMRCGAKGRRVPVARQGLIGTLCFHALALGRTVARQPPVR